MRGPGLFLASLEEGRGNFCIGCLFRVHLRGGSVLYPGWSRPPLGETRFKAGFAPGGMAQRTQPLGPAFWGGATLLEEKPGLAARHLNYRGGSLCR